MRRREVMQKKYGFVPLGDANSGVKQLIFGTNATRLYRSRSTISAGVPLGAPMPYQALAS
jgi:hypothetical protein